MNRNTAASEHHTPPPPGLLVHRRCEGAHLFLVTGTRKRMEGEGGCSVLPFFCDNVKDEVLKLLTARCTICSVHDKVTQLEENNQHVG